MQLESLNAALLTNFGTEANSSLCQFLCTLLIRHWCVHWVGAVGFHKTINAARANSEYSFMWV